MSPSSKESPSLLSALRKKSPRVVQLGASFWAIRAAIQQEIVEWVAVDGTLATQKAIGRTLDVHWCEAIDQLNIGDADRRDELAGELLGAHIDYCCLTLTIDRGPIFEKVKAPLLSIRRQLEAAERMLERRESDYSDRVGAAVSNFIRIHHPESAAEQGSEKRIGENLTREIQEQLKQLEIKIAAVVEGERVLSGQFDLKARQFIHITRRRLDRLLEPVEIFAASERRGRPPKYSKQFLILRCARLFEEFDPAGRKAEVKQISEAKRQRLGNLAPAYPTGFVPFVQEVLKAIDPKQVGSPHSLGKTIGKVLKMRIAHDDGFVTWIVPCDASVPPREDE